jgi:hypothetical protein
LLVAWPISCSATEMCLFGTAIFLSKSKLLNAKLPNDKFDQKRHIVERQIVGTSSSRHPT